LEIDFVGLVELSPVVALQFYRKMFLWANLTPFLSEKLCFYLVSERESKRSSALALQH